MNDGYGGNEDFDYYAAADGGMAATSSSINHSNNSSIDGQPIIPPTPDDFKPAGSWGSYYRVGNMTRRKTAAHVMAEVDEDIDHAPEVDSLLDDEVEQDGLPHPVKKGLAKVLTKWDVIAYGVSSTIGAGIFVSTGAGTQAAGPAVMISFFLASLSCLFSAFAYCEFAARVPVSGSAYTFTYVCLGELAAWFIGWNLTLEYCISAAAVARAWASNLVLFFAQVGVTLPTWMNSIHLVGEEGTFLYSMSLLSALICILCTLLLLVGVKESSRVNMAVTIMNVSIILFVIIAGATYISFDNYVAAKPDNFNVTSGCEFPHQKVNLPTPSDNAPFQIQVTGTDSWLMPLSFSTDVKVSSTPVIHPAKGSYVANGLNGVLTGAALVFFAFVGFDSVTTLAEEVKSPKTDLPFGILVTLAISTTLYLGASFVIAGMVPWYCVDVNAPLAQAFQSAGNSWATTLISACTVTGLSATCLASLFGQPRIFYRMAKDGLIFKAFAKVHPKTQTPYWGTIITGGVAGTIALFLSIDSLQNMISIGTLMAFSTVCAGVIVMRYQPLPDNQLPMWKSSPVFWLLVFLVPATALCVCMRFHDELHFSILIVLFVLTIATVFGMSRLPVNEGNINPDLFMCPLCPWLPSLGILTNLYLIASLDWESYVRIAIWTVLGFAIYFVYGIRYSRLGYIDAMRKEISDARDA